MMIRIDSLVLDNLSALASASPRLRMNRDMRNSDKDNSQRMLNALEPGTVLPIHRHRFTSESVVVLRGKAVQFLYDDNGNVTDEILMQPDSECVGMNVPAGVWHRMESLQHGTVIFEAKDGAYQPLSEIDILNL